MTLGPIRARRRGFITGRANVDLTHLVANSFGEWLAAFWNLLRLHLPLVHRANQ